MTRRAFEYHHTVGFEETNLVGNVYYVNHLSWQGRCRELFLHEHAPDILEQLQRDLRLVTVRCSCDYFAELFAFDEVILRMRLGSLSQHRLSLLFEYVRRSADGDQVVARGEQEIACMRQEGDRTTPTPVPESLRHALADYA